MYKLRKIKRKDLDLEKYSNALNDSLNYRIYAEYWYLDVLMDENWECWIYGDYEVIMPIPYQLKLGVKFVLQPTYCQQLGVFYKEEISRELFQQFEKKLHKYFVRSYSFNEENTASFQPKGEPRVNYILNLNRPYEEVKKSFSKSTKWNLRQFVKSGYVVDFENFDLGLIIAKHRSLGLFSSNFYDMLSRVSEELIFRKKIQMGSVYLEDGKLSASSSFVDSRDRIIYLSSITDEIGKKGGFPTGLINFILENNSGKSISLDFEGSSVPPIAAFFKGFGAQKSYYTVYSNFKFRANRILKYQ